MFKRMCGLVAENGFSIRHLHEMRMFNMIGEWLHRSVRMERTIDNEKFVFEGFERCSNVGFGSVGLGCDDR